MDPSHGLVCAGMTAPDMTGPDLRVWRLAMGMTQAELAEALGVRENTVSRWERDAMAIANPRMLRLALEAIAVHRGTSSP